MLVPATPARAGGSLIEGRRAYGVRETATFRGSFSMSGSYEGRLSDGPYIGYLAPVDIYDIDHPRTIRLGEIQMRRSAGWGMIASITFVVPNVATGQYHLMYCNDPCTVNGIGDLMGGGPFYIAPTHMEAVFLARLDRMASRVDSARTYGRVRTRAAVRAIERQLEISMEELAAAQARIVTLERSFAELRAASPRQEDRPAPLVPSWALLAASLVVAVSLVGSTAIMRRRRVPPLIVPDTISDELETGEPALRS